MERFGTLGNLPVKMDQLQGVVPFDRLVKSDQKLPFHLRNKSVES